MVRRRSVVLVAWLALVTLGALSALGLPGLLSTSLAVPGTGSERADAVLVAHFGQNIEGTFSVVYRVDRPSNATVRTLDAGLVAAARLIPTAHATPLQAGAGVLYGSVTTALDLQHAAPYTAVLRHDLDRAGSPAVYVTGPPALQHDITPILAADLRRGELIALAGGLVLLVLVLGLSAAVAVPLVVATCTAAATLAIIYGLAHAVLMVLYIPNLVELIGLGLAVDYSLLIVHRFREELANGDVCVDDAVVATIATAGRTVVLSGVAVGIGLAALVLVPVPFVRSLGLAGFLVPLVSILAALTLQPALLSVLGRRGMRSVGLDVAKRRRHVEQRFFARLARVVLGHRLAVAASALILLGLAAAPIAGLQLTPGSLSAIPQNIASARALNLLRDRVSPGAVTPIEIVLDAGAPGRARTHAGTTASLRLARELLKDPEVYVVAIGTKPPYVDPSGRYGLTLVVGRHDFGAEASQRLVHDIRDRVIPAAHLPPGEHAYVGGAPAQGSDFLGRVYGSFPWIALLVLGLAYLVLLRAFRSLLLPLMAILLDALSVGATYGLLVVVFRYGIGADTLGLYRVSQIEGWVPAFLFAMLFGLSMDYEVFLVSRMRESWDAGNDHGTAVTEGLVRTGKVVSAAALIMVAALSGLAAGHIAGLQELGVGLALGVLIDVTLVRGLLMPSLMALLGPWSWWLPAPLARLTVVAASPLAQRARRGSTTASGMASTSRP